MRRGVYLLLNAAKCANSGKISTKEQQEQFLAGRLEQRRKGGLFMRAERPLAGGTFWLPVCALP
jgi:hypothetical protein